MQLDLFSSPQPLEKKHSVFLALFPDHDTASRMSVLAAAIRSKHHLTGKLRPHDHLHLTLHAFEEYSEIPATLVQTIGQACEAFARNASPFEVTLNRVMRFGGIEDSKSRAIALKGSDETDSNVALMGFHKRLCSELIKVSVFNAKSPKFNPHVTLFYDREHLQEETVQSITWTVHELVLIHSEIGETKYHRLGQWRFVL